MGRIKTILENSPLIIVLVYILLGSVWIQYSDQFVLSTFEDPGTITWVQSLKGWFFVLVSGIMIYVLVWKNNDLLSKAINNLRKSRDDFRATFEFAPVGIAHHRPNENWIQVNRTLCNMLGYKKEELLKLNFEDFIHPEDLTIGRSLDQELVEQKRSFYKVEKRYRRKDGSYFPGLVRKSVVFNQKENQIYLVVMLEDITSHNQAKEALAKSVREKEVLLAEIHHRVRNNLALISAFFDLQAMHTDNEQVQAILHDSQMRVKCLALIHESYAEAEKTSYINFGKYLHQLSDFVNKTFKNKQINIITKKDISPVPLNINQAIPAGLVCNELLINAHLNSFREVKEPVIEVSLKEHANEIIMKVSNNGVQQAMEYNEEEPETLSMLIIKTLCSQLKSNLEVNEQKNGSSCKLRFQKRDLKGPSSAI